MEHKESALSAMLKGSMAGLMGTVVLTAAIKYAPTLLRELGIDAPEPPAAAKRAKPVERLAGKVAKGVFDKQLDKEGKEAGGQVLHWTYGLGWGAYYGFMQSMLKLPFLLHGTLLGGLMTLTASTIIPALGVAPSADKVPTDQKVMQASFIMMYGWTTALAYRFLSKDQEGKHPR
jgi:hypothetical protein